MKITSSRKTPLNPDSNLSLTMARYPVRMLHFIELGAVLGLLLSITLHSIKHRPLPQEIVEWEQVEKPIPTPKPSNIADGDTVVDSDGDGMPDDWEIQFSHNPNNPADKDSDFDLDGVSALQEYQIFIASNGSAGNPLGNYTLENILPPTGYTTTPSIAPVESAANGIVLARVSGVQIGNTVSSTLHYIYRPAEKSWTKVTPPSGVTANITCLDVNSQGQVAGYYSQSGYKGFIWTPSSTNPSSGTASPYVINPTSASPLQAIPVKISNTGYSLYASSPGGLRKPADHRRRAITPVSNSGTSVNYLDVNDYGEFIGTVYDPYSFKTKTFLVIPEGMLFLTSIGYDDMPIAEASVVPPNIDVATLQWEYPSFTYPDDWYDEYGNYTDPYVYSGYFEVAYATDATTGVSYIFRKGFNYNYNYDSYYSTGNLIYFREDDGTSIASQGYLEWQGFHMQSSPAALNDWGEFSGVYSYLYGNAYDYNVGDGFYTESYEASQNGSFIYDGNYQIFQESSSITSINNQKQILNAMGSVNRLYSDGVIVPVTKLVSNVNYSRAFRLSDNGILYTQLNSTLKLLRPNIDVEGDGLPDDWERLYGLNPSLQDSLGDIDGDGINNYAEYKLGTNPTLPPVIGDDGEEVDMREGIDNDEDGIPNTWEHLNAMDYDNAADAAQDFDRDGFTNLKEYQLGTDHRGAPTFKIHEPGPFANTSSTSINSALLGAGRSVGSSLLPLDATCHEKLFFSAVSSPQFQNRLALWSKDATNDIGSFSIYNSPVSNTFYPLAISSTGASLAQSYGSQSGFNYWSSPNASAIMLSGAALQNNIASLSYANLSPSGNYLGATRTPASGGNQELVIWKMPSSATQTWKPVKLSAPVGITLNLQQQLYVNDFGYAVGMGTNAMGKSTTLLWKLDATATSVSAVVCSALVSNGWSRPVGITNHASPIIVGNSATSTNQSRAVAWTQNGQIRDLGTLADGNSTTISAVSPAGYLAGTGNTLVNGSVVNRPFIAAPPAETSLDRTAYRLVVQESNAQNFQITKIVDSGEVLGVTYVYSPEYRQVPTLWRHGKMHTLDNILPTSSGYVLDSVQQINSNGSLLATAWKNGALTKILLTADSDTDNDGLPDVFENQYEFNAYIANSSNADTDADGLSDRNEFRYATSPRNADTDSDGMKDGWEVEWGFLPLDPSDASLDPDEDRVSNLRESQIGTSPTGYYKVETLHTDIDGAYPSLISVNDAGDIIHTGLNSYDYGIDENGFNYSNYYQQNQALLHGDQAASMVLPIQSSFNAYSSNWTDYNYQSNIPTYYLDADQGQIHGFMQSNGYSYMDGNSNWFDTAFLIPDAVNQPNQEYWISWDTVIYNLRETLDEEYNPVLASEESLYIYSHVTSPTGNCRIVQSSYGQQIMIDASGNYIKTLPNTTTWQGVNNAGDAVGIHYSYMALPGGTYSYIPELCVYRYGSLSQFPLLEAVSGSVTIKSYSDDDKVHLTISRKSQQGVWKNEDYIADANNYGSLKRIRKPGLGNETIIALSRENGRTVGIGPKPFITTKDGTSIRLEALRLKQQAGAPIVPLTSAYPRQLSPAHISSDGSVTLSTVNVSGATEFLRIVPNNDADNDGIPDDWENSYIAWLQARSDLSEVSFAGVNSSTIDGDEDLAGDGITMLNEYNLDNTQVSRGDNPNSGEARRAEIMLYDRSVNVGSGFGEFGFLGEADPIFTKITKSVAGGRSNSDDAATYSNSGSHVYVKEYVEDGWIENDYGYGTKYFYQNYKTIEKSSGQWTYNTIYKVDDDCEDGTMLTQTITAKYVEAEDVEDTNEDDSGESQDEDDSGEDAESQEDDDAGEVSVIEHETITTRKNEDPEITENGSVGLPALTPSGGYDEPLSNTTLSKTVDGYSYSQNLTGAISIEQSLVKSHQKAKSEIGRVQFSSARNYGTMYGVQDDGATRYRFEYDTMGSRGDYKKSDGLQYDTSVQIGELKCRVNAQQQPVVVVVEKIFFGYVEDGPVSMIEESYTVLPGKNKTINVLADPGSYRLLLCRVRTADNGGINNGILEVAGGDHDGDEVPDFADSLSNLFEQDGHHPQGFSEAEIGYGLDENRTMASTEAKPFGITRVSHEYIPISRYPAAKIKYTYDESDPSLMEREEIGSGYARKISYKLPENGALRLWCRDGDKKRDVRPVHQGGHYVPSNIWLNVADVSSASTDDPDDGVYLKSLYVESLKASQVLGDQSIKCEIDFDGNGTVDFVNTERFTSISTGFWSVNAEIGSTTEKLQAMRNSLPAPDVNVSNLTITNERASADGKKLLVDLTVRGTVTSAICDINKSHGGKIERGYCVVNAIAHPQSFVTVTGQKSMNGKLGRPYPFDGAFSHVMKDVEVMEGNNVCRVVMKDPLYFIPGEATISFTISATPGVIEPYTLGGTLDEDSLSARVKILDSIGHEADVSFGDGDTNSVSQVRVTATAANPLILESVDGSVTLKLPKPYVEDDNTQQFLDATVTIGNQELALTDMVESSEFSDDYVWSFEQLSSSWQSSGYSGWIVQCDHQEPPDKTGGAGYEPMALKLEGPDALIAGIKHIEMAGVKLKVVKNPEDDDYYVASEEDPTRPATIVVVNSPRVNIADIALNGVSTVPVADFVEEPGDGASLSDMKHMMDYLDRNRDGEVTGADYLQLMGMRASAVFHMYTDLQYYKGLLFGLIGNPCDSVADLCGLFKFGLKAAWETSPLLGAATPLGALKIAYEFTFGDRFQGEIAAAKRAWDTVKGWATEVAAFIDETVKQGHEAFVRASLNGVELPGMKKLGKLARAAVDTIFMILIIGEDAISKLSHYQIGYGLGYIAAEFVISGLAALLTAEAGGAGALVTIGRHAPKLSKLLRLLRPAISKLVTALSDYTDLGKLLNKIGDWLDISRLQKWCFVAGTSILTSTGAVAIENIEPGMMVWCAPENGQGVGCYRPVLETYQNRADVIYHIAYDHDGQAVTPEVILSASAEHPIWVEERGAFVPAAELQSGSTLRMASGQGGLVGEITRLNTASSGGTRVYNFAVAEHHTYFAGSGGVWVHNLCTEGLKRFAAKFESLLDEELKHLDGLDDSKAYDGVAERIRESIKKDLGLNDKEVEEGLAYTWDKIRTKTESPKEQWDGIEEVLESRKDNHLRRGNAADDIRSRYYETLGGHREVEVISSSGRGARLDNWIPGDERISRKDTDRFEEMLSGIREFDSKYDNALLADTEYARLNYPDLIGKEISGNKILEIPPLAPGATLPANVLQEAASRGIRIRDYAGKFIE